MEKKKKYYSPRTFSPQKPICFKDDNSQIHGRKEYVLTGKILDTDTQKRR